MRRPRGGCNVRHNAELSSVGILQSPMAAWSNLFLGTTIAARWNVLKSFGRPSREVRFGSFASFSGPREDVRFTMEADTKADINEQFETLTARERHVLREVARGRLNKQVAFDLSISEVTVICTAMSCGRCMPRPSGI